MLPQSQPKQAKNSAKVNLTISAVFHGLLILALIYFAAHEGYLGKKLKEITVYKVEKEKPPEKSPEKPKELPKETPKPVDQPKAAEAAKPLAAPPLWLAGKPSIRGLAPLMRFAVAITCQAVSPGD